MDPTSCMKGLVMAGSQFRNNRSDANILQLQRQIELMISLTMKGRSVKFFNPQQILPMECLSCLCDVIEDHHTPAALSHKTIVLLNNLASYPDIRDAMHTTFNFTSSLAIFLQYHTQSPGEPLVLQTLQLLQKLTYKSKVSYPNSYMEELIRFLISHVLAHESDLTAPCLGLLANLCKNNLSIQAHVKALENVKSIYRTLIAYVSHSNQSIVVYSFSILSNLCLNEEIGEKVFNAKNIYQTFQLIFNIIVNGDSSHVRGFTCDLFIGLLKSPKIQQSVVIYEHFEACLMQVLHLITMDTESATKIFELLLSFCSVNGLRCTVCRALLNTPSLQDPDRYQPQIHQRQITEPFFALVHWAGQSVETHDQAPLFALDLLKEIFEEVIDSGLSAQLSPRTDVVVPMAVEQLTPPCDTDGSVLKLKCLKTVKALDVLLVLCNDEAMKLQVAEAVDTKVCSTLLEHQYQHNRLGMTTGHCGMEEDWSEAGVDLVLHTLELMSRIKTYVANMDMMFYETLQDQRLVAFLAFSLTNDTRARVQLALRLLNQALPLPEFPAIMLGDSIAAYNAKQATERKVLNIGNTEVPGSPGKLHSGKASVNYNGTDMGKARGKGSPQREGSVDTLIDRMNSGLEIKDVKASEIMDLYEHKLASLATKESHLQDLLEAKQLALAQADRLIAQYKSRRAQSEAEARKLASMLQESERRSESYRDQINELRLDKERQVEDMEQLVGQNSKLQAIAEEYEQLQAAYAEQIQRVEALQRSVNAHMDEQKSLREMNEMLRRHNESLKNQIEDEKKRLTKQLKDKDAKLTEEKDKVRTLEHEKEDLETAVDKYRNELTKLEQVKKETVKKYEASIAEKDALIKTQKAELDKNAQIVAMIHNISAGVKS
ncbi:protein CIP2A homolog [Branchiostoma floridae x Branchiostoma japonicum]